MVWSKIKIYISSFPARAWEWIEGLRQDKNLIIFLVFLVISTGFWFLNALSKQYTATLSYPVRLVNIPDDKMLPDDFKGRIELKVRAGGFVILRYRVSNNFLPLTFDVSEMKPASRKDTGGVYSLASEEHTRIVGQLSQGMELIEINPDTLFIPLIEQGRNKVPVRAKTNLGFEKQFLQAGPVILQPDSIEVSGPKPIIDTLSFVDTHELVFDNLADTVATMVPLNVPATIKSSVKRVSAIIPVEPFTEMNFHVPLRITGLPDTLRIKTFPSEIQVSFRVGISKYEHIDESHFRPVVDASQVLGEDRSDRLKVKMERTPSDLESLSFSPIFVEYLLEKKK